MTLVRALATCCALACLGVAVPAADDKPHPIAVQVKAALKDPSKPFTMVVQLNVKAGQQERFEAAFAPAIKATRKEKGCLAYDLNRDTKSPTAYMVYERWQNITALEAHLKTAHIVKLLETVGDMLEGPPEARALLPAGE